MEKIKFSSPPCIMPLWDKKFRSIRHYSIYVFLSPSFARYSLIILALWLSQIPFLVFTMERIEYRRTDHVTRETNNCRPHSWSDVISVWSFSFRIDRWHMIRVDIWLKLFYNLSIWLKPFFNYFNHGQHWSHFNEISFFLFCIVFGWIGNLNTLGMVGRSYQGRSFTSETLRKI